MKEKWAEFGENIKEKRVSLGLTQSYIAQKVHKDVSTVARWEMGSRRPTQGSLLTLSSVLNIKIQTLQALAGYTPEFDWYVSLVSKPGSKEDILSTATEEENEDLRQYLHYIRFSDQVRSKHT
ncbi:multiprotein-bridging factor 1 family protein [Chloroflexota bacterium]